MMDGSMASDSGALVASSGSDMVSNEVVVDNGSIGRQ